MNRTMQITIGNLLRGTPDYDSESFAISQGATLTKDHDLGTLNVFVDVQFYSGANSWHNLYYGQKWINVDSWSEGVSWKNLTTNQISVVRSANDTVVTSVRIRIWKLV